LPELIAELDMARSMASQVTQEGGHSRLQVAA